MQNFATPLGKGVTPPSQTNNLIGGVIGNAENFEHSTHEITNDITKEAAKQIDEYFKKKRKKFELPLRPKGTSFQLAAWNALVSIPYGETRTYKQIAEFLENPKACRAVGSANNKNPIPIIIPCHRVIGADGSLTGYAYGIEMKKRLLALENSGEF
ncbi:MAG: methylated-DNA--[protein]-cysteine S-methyltransferase [Defluviitaleaceae bacterium]|nr:methylated-DNA--[protein]-cysteine S-methyltransferase [Defluviitaleaceae bacterium]